ncbi:MAG: DUF4142 domain-containing protein [Pirellulales bacterium]
MQTSVRIRIAVFALVPALALAGAAWSQQSDDPSSESQDQATQAGSQARQAAQAGQRQQAARAQAGRGQQAGQLDPMLIAWLEIGNQGEIALAEFAQQRAQSDEVKQFARQMIEDHQQFLDQLRQGTAAAGGNRQKPGARGAESPQERLNAQGQANRQEAALQAGRQNPQGQARAAAGQQLVGTGAMDSQLIQLKRQIGQQHVASLQRELEEKSEQEFDRCYLGQQVLAHIEMLDTLKVFQQQASPELKQTLAQGQQTTQQHLEHAKELLKQVEEQSGADTARRPATGQRRQN